MKVSELTINNNPNYNNSYVIIDNYHNSTHYTERYAIGNFVLQNQLSNYVTYSDLSNYVTFDDLPNNSDTGDFISISTLQEGQIPIITGNGQYKYSGIRPNQILTQIYTSEDTSYYDSLIDNPLSQYELLITDDDNNHVQKIRIDDLATFIQNYTP